MIRAPEFWQKQGILPLLLLPFSRAYQWMHASRIAHISPQIMPVPVICVGNLVAGGAGKTPFVLYLMEYFQKQNQNIHCISRGYKGQLQGPLKVDPSHHSYQQVGDEPLLIAKQGPCWIARKRHEAALAAITDGAELILMDDGLQNPTLHKDITFMVIDGGYGFGNGYILPAGPLREPIALGMAKADAIVLIGEDKTNVTTHIPPEKPVIKAQFKPKISPQSQAQKYVAFAGIGRPQKFYDTLEQAGYALATTHDFPDHYPYKTQDLTMLKELAAKHQASLITTAKDAVRIPEPYQESVEVLEVTLEIEQVAELEKILAASINASSENH